MGFLIFPLSHQDVEYNYVINFYLVAHPQQSLGSISEPVQNESSIALLCGI